MKTILVLILFLSFSVGFAAKPDLAAQSSLGQAEPDLAEYDKVNLPTRVQEGLSYKDVQEVVPVDMLPTENPSEVANRIGDRIIQNWLKSEAVRSSAMGKTATTVENAMKAEVKVQKTKPEGVEHRFAFQFQALQALAKIDYTGWLNATLNYDARSSQAAIEVKEKIWNNKDFFINHKVSSIEDSSNLGLRWSW